MRAVELLRQVDDVIQSLRMQGKRYAHYEALFAEWAGAVFSYQTPWQGDSGNRTALAESTIHTLTALGNYIEDMPALSALDGDQQVSLSAAIREIIDLLDDESLELDPAVRRYVFELIATIQRLLSEYSVLGRAELLASIHELFGYLTILAADLEASEETKGFGERLKERAWNLVPYTQFAVKYGMKALGFAADLKELGS
jgi:hypothetical protein